jgi:D-threonine aldolase
VEPVNEGAERLGGDLAWLAQAEGSRELATPFLAADLGLVERNIDEMARGFATGTRRLRPHMKAHKCSAVALMQMAGGACGVTCATTDEAVAALDAGIGDVLVANVVADPVRLRDLLGRMASAASARLALVVDSPGALAMAAGAAARAGVKLGALVEIDIGVGRSGVGDVEEGLALAAAIAASEALELRGVQAYEGHLVKVADPDERRRRCLAAFAPAIRLAEALAARGLCGTITGGSTATWDAVPEVAEVQAGTYVFMDATYGMRAPRFVPALALIATVVSVRPDGTVVCNAGSKSLATDLGAPQWVLGAAQHRSTSEEHLVLRIEDGPIPRVGDRVPILPGHACTTIAMAGRIVGCRDGGVERVLRIDGNETVRRASRLGRPA